jgi:hypothetical protein
MMIMHIVAYLAIIINNVLTMIIATNDLRAFEISAICNLAVYSMCTVIFGVIVN